MSRSRCSKLSGTETILGMCEHLLTKKTFFASLVIFCQLTTSYNILNLLLIF